MLPYAADNYAAAIDKRGIEHKNQLSSRLFVTGDNFEVGCGKVYLFSLKVSAKKSTGIFEKTMHSGSHMRRHVNEREASNK